MVLRSLFIAASCNLFLSSPVAAIYIISIDLNDSTHKYGHVDHSRRKPVKPKDSKMSSLIRVLNDTVRNYIRMMV